jgi:hypothetical protein
VSKIRCDGKFEKFYKIFWEVNRAKDRLSTRRGHGDGDAAPVASVARRRGARLRLRALDRGVRARRDAYRAALAHSSCHAGLDTGRVYPNSIQAPFTSHVNLNYFLFHLSHQIFKRIHGVLNMGKK